MELAIDRCIRLVVAEAVLHEAEGVLMEKFPAYVSVLDVFLTLVDYDWVPLPPRHAVKTASAHCRDADDALILASVLIGKPDYALTGDKDLLTEEVRAVAPVCRCAEYLARRRGARHRPPFPHLPLLHPPVYNDPRP